MDTVHRTPNSGRQSLFYQDLASPITTRKGKFSTTGQAAAVSALWQENFGNSDLPPPPVFTLDDSSGSDFSPEYGIAGYPLSPELKSDPRTPIESRDFSSSPMQRKSNTSTSYTPRSGYSLWLTSKGGSSEQEDKGKGSPVEGVIQPGALITLPAPREIARLELERNCLPAPKLNEEEWITVYGFSPADTNVVLREFEKCGEILKHVTGPRDANWMHIFYQNRSDAHKALNKNGIQINGVIIVGVKPVDPRHWQTLDEKLNNPGFMAIPPVSSRTSELVATRGPARPYNLQNCNSNPRQAEGINIASPTKSLVSKAMDLMFGV